MDDTARRPSRSVLSKRQHRFLDAVFQHVNAALTVREAAPFVAAKTTTAHTQKLPAKARGRRFTVVVRSACRQRHSPRLELRQSLRHRGGGNRISTMRTLRRDASGRGLKISARRCPPAAGRKISFRRSSVCSPPANADVSGLSCPFQRRHDAGRVLRKGIGAISSACLLGVDLCPVQTARDSVWALHPFLCVPSVSPCPQETRTFEDRISC